ncbi:hypothetical protein [Subtercola endophyticus]|uniref:hypothetical protein n=1 Tax=Subtercola endophyticus TaxID=2895559 RepID=UPI001E2A3B36|nr:hypothetical protein [Subtercola endophyticus]UFS59477.1 hypothetical protein LQ955_01360 [Subtercola endophyticus]
MTDTEDAPHVFVRGEGGSVFKLDLPLHESIEDRLRKGYLTRVEEDGSPIAVETADDGVIPGPPTKRPPLNADKATWVGWAVVNGMTPDLAEAATKQDLIEKFGVDQASETLSQPEAEAQVAIDAAPDLAIQSVEAGTAQ